MIEAAWGRELVRGAGDISVCGLGVEMKHAGSGWTFDIEDLNLIPTLTLIRDPKLPGAQPSHSFGSNPDGPYHIRNAALKVAGVAQPSSAPFAVG